MNKVYLALFIVIIILNVAILAVLSQPKSENQPILQATPTPSPLPTSTPTQLPTLASTPTDTGLIGNGEQITASNPVFTANTVTLAIRNSGASSITISSGSIDGTVATPTGNLTIAKGATQGITLSLASGTFTAGAQYQLALFTAKGNAVVYTATYNP